MKRLLAGTLATVTLGAGGTFAVDQAVNPYEDKATHFELPITSDIPQGERVEIAKDKAELTLIGWNDEYAIKIIPQIPTASFGGINKDFNVEATRPLLSKRMEYKSGDVTAFIEPKEGTDNEFDIDFTLESMPDTNVFEYKIEGAEGFDFHYQPALTSEEIAEGAERPENVVGSYAVYHKTKANHRVGSTNYANGKAFHIYRPKAIDANGAEVWAELSYADGVLSVTVPAKWLETATYPVRVDPTFGYTSIGASFSNTNTQNFGRFTSPSDAASITTITAYNEDTTPTSARGAALYANQSADATPGAFIASDTANVTISGAAWYDNSISVSISPSTIYWLAQWTQDSFARFYYDDSVTGNKQCIEGGTFETWEDPITTENACTADRAISIYATYTASAAASNTITPKALLQSGQLLIQSGQVIVQ